MPDSLDPPAAARTPTNRARRSTGRSVLSDVAKLAGVSTATVSRVYNEPDKVSANVRERVEHAALTLNWFPNAAGRALASTRSHIAGIIIPTLDDRVFASQVSGMQAAFAARGITLVLGCSNYDPAQALTQVRAMLARGVEAMAVVGEAHPPELFDALRLYRVPYAVTYAYRKDSPHTCIGFDNHAAYAEITEHLIGLGHRSFAVCIQPTRDNDRVQARVAGIRATLERHGLAVRPEHMFEGESTMGFGRRSLRTIWQAPGERPDRDHLRQRPYRAGRAARGGRTGHRDSRRIVRHRFRRSGDGAGDSPRADHDARRHLRDRTARRAVSARHARRQASAARARGACALPAQALDGTGREIVSRRGALSTDYSVAVTPPST